MEIVKDRHKSNVHFLHITTNEPTTEKNSAISPNPTVAKNATAHHPEEMIHDFCHLFTIKECRKMLWKMTCAFLGSEHADGLNRHERSDYIFLYEMLLALVKASYLIEAKRHKQ